MKYEMRVSSYLSGNGYIEGRELDDFLREFVSSVSLTDVGPEVSRCADKLSSSEAQNMYVGMCLECFERPSARKGVHSTIASITPYSNSRSWGTLRDGGSF